MDKAIRIKLKRLEQSKRPRVIDIFAGCGGMSLGFLAAGFEIAAAVELDALAIQSHALNFNKHDKEAARLLHSKPRDITSLEPSDLVHELGLQDSPENAFDILIGGPPCQAFARVGRAKLREIDEHPEAFLRDPRSNLYLRYLHYVRGLKPLALVMENVPDVMNFGGHNICEEVCEVLQDIGYDCGYTLLNSAFYGVPQMRQRMFLIAVRKELNADIAFPEPTHWVELPPGYAGSRDVAMRVLKTNGYAGNRARLIDGHEAEAHFFIEPPEASGRLPPAVTTEEALCDLPSITVHLEGKLKRGARRFTELSRYREDIAPTPYATQMRTWSGFESTVGIYDHVIRSLPRDYAIFKRMRPGDQYPQAYELANCICEEERRRRRIKKGSKEHLALQSKIIPPYDPTKFPNKWRKLEGYLPSRTLLAHIGKDTYSHIHYDSEQSRTISVREAARLQSFPDGFVFAGTMNPAFRQIGNAVPPLMAKAIASSISKLIAFHAPGDGPRSVDTTQLLELR